MNRHILAGLGGLAMVAAFSLPASASVIVAIGDGEAPYNAFFPPNNLVTGITAGATGSLDPSSLNISITQEANGVLGAADLHFDFHSNGVVPVPGSVVTANYDLFEPAGVSEGPGSPVCTVFSCLSDTVSITLSGHTPTGVTDTNNVSADIHFRSDSLDGIPPTELAGGTDITETGGYQKLNTTLADFSLFVRSDVPEPMTLSLLGAGLVGLSAIRRRGKRS